MNNCLQGWIERVLFPSLPDSTCTLPGAGFHRVSRPLPAPWKRSQDLWTASLWHHWQREVHRSLRFHASLPSILNSPTTLCPEDVYYLKAQSVTPQRNTLPTGRCVHHGWDGEAIPTVADKIKVNPAWNAPCCLLLSSARWSLAKVPEEPNTPSFPATGVKSEGQGGTVPCHTASLCDCSSWFLLSSPPPTPRPYPLLFLGTTGCTAGRASVLLSPCCRQENTSLETFGNLSKFLDSLVVAERGQTQECWFQSNPDLHKFEIHSKRRNVGFQAWNSCSLGKWHPPTSAFSGSLVCKIDSKYGHSSLSKRSTLVMYLKVLIGI